ncbi:MAG: outer membrane beta-barrel protein [Paludibacter sp.]
MKKTLFLTGFMCMIIIKPIFAQQSVVAEQPTKKGFRVAIGGGYGMQLGKREKQSDPKLEQLSKDLMNGFVLDFDAQYFFGSIWGIGINANYVQGNAEANDVNINDVGVIDYYRESPVYFYAGPALASRSEGTKFRMITSIGAGPIFYTDRVFLNSIQMNGKATTFGLNAGVGGEYKISNKMGIGIKASYTIGSIKSLTVGNQTVDLASTQSVSNLMFTLYLSLYGRK